MSEATHEMFDSLDDPEQFLVHDMRFHQTVAAASGNRILTSLMNRVATILFDVRSKTVKRAKDLKESAEMHRKIYRVIREHNSEAARDRMRDHLMLAQRAQAAEGVDYANSCYLADAEAKGSSDSAEENHEPRSRREPSP